MLIELFGGSQFLANTFIRHPEQLDTLVRADLVRVHRSADELAAELQPALRGRRGLRGGARRAAALPQPGVSAHRHQRPAVAARAGRGQRRADGAGGGVSAERLRGGGPGRLPALRLPARCPGASSCLAMGKLGSGELNYNSDLDLIFVYDDADGDCRAAVGARMLQQVRPAADHRACRRRRRKGSSTASTRGCGRRDAPGRWCRRSTGFRQYHETSAQVWERQALIKARPVAGDADAGGAGGRDRGGVRLSRPAAAPTRCARSAGCGSAWSASWRVKATGGSTSRPAAVGWSTSSSSRRCCSCRYGAHEPRVRVRDTLGRLGGLGRDRRAVGRRHPLAGRRLPLLAACRERPAAGVRPAGGRSGARRVRTSAWWPSAWGSRARRRRCATPCGASTSGGAR